MQPLNIQLIKSRIKSAHKGFLDSVGPIPEKLTADHQLFVQRMGSRIQTILDCFLKAKIIDDISIGKQNGESDKSCLRFKLTKKGFDRSVYVWTDGANISVNTTQYPMLSGLNIDNGISFRNVEFDTYNWVEFADELLHFIHRVIYSSIKSYETKIFK